MMTNIITLKSLEKWSNKMQKDKGCSQSIYQITCITSRCVFFSISLLFKNDDDIVRGGGWKVMIGIIISENDDNCGPPLTHVVYKSFCFCTRADFLLSPCMTVTLFLYELYLQSYQYFTIPKAKPALHYKGPKKSNQ